MRVPAAALAFCLAGCASLPEASPPVVATWRPVGPETGRIVDLAGLQALARDIPDSTSVRLRLLNAQLEVEDIEGALDTLRWLKLRGHVFSADARRQLPGMLGEDRAEMVKSLLLDPPTVIASSTLAATIPAEAGLVESVLLESSSGQIAVTSVSQHGVWTRSPGGEFAAVLPRDAGNLSGIVFDPSRSAIWAASANLDEHSAARNEFAGLLEIIPGGAAGRRIAAPRGVNLSDLHRAQDGTIYASDPLGGGVYVIAPAAATIETLIAPGMMRSPQGLVTDGSGAKLYVSDYRYGIAVVDLRTKAVSRLSSRLPIALDGIDGLWRNGNELIAMQNGTSPRRIISLSLSEDGMRVTGTRILEQAHPEWTEPLSGHFEGGSLYYVANGQWDRWAEGKAVEGKPFGDTYVFKLDVAPAAMAR